MKFRKKPVVIETFRYNVDSRPDWFQDKVTSNDVITFEEYCLINTLEGQRIGNKGDWIIRGVKGELYPCKPDIFNETYEPVKEVETPEQRAEKAYQTIQETQAMNEKLRKMGLAPKIRPGYFDGE